MPNYYSLTRKSAPEGGPVHAQQIDDEMRVHFGAPPSATEWFRQWKDYVGMYLAMGRTFEYLRNLPNYNNEPWPENLKREWIEVIDWLDANFVADAWAGR